MDERVVGLLDKFENKEDGDTTFLDEINDIVGKKAPLRAHLVRHLRSHFFLS
jgi:hypothetical protein